MSLEDQSTPGCFSPLFSKFRKSASSQKAKSQATPPEEVACTCNCGGLMPPPSYAPSHAKVSSTSQAVLDEKHADWADPKDIELLECTVNELSKPLRKFSLEMHANPELAMKEYKTHDLIANFMDKQDGFKVTRHAYGLETAVEAVFEVGEGGRTVGFISEMDALPGIGHACGHNLIAIAGIAGAVATARALKKADIPGKVVLFGTPAEEDLGGKVIMIKKKAFDNMDACLMAHPAPYTGVVGWLAISTSTATFRGKGAHAGGAPWEGVNAMDAAVIGYNAISTLRQQIHPEERLHGIIKGTEGLTFNIIPDFSKLQFGIRSPTLDGMRKLRKKVWNCYEAGAKATGCDLDIKTEYSYWDVKNNAPLADEYVRYMGKAQDRDVPKSGAVLGSTDFGNVSYVTPGLHPLFAIPTKGVNHTKAFADAAATHEAHVETIKVAKGLAVTGWRVLVDDRFAKAAKEDLEKSMAGF